MGFVAIFVLSNLHCYTFGPVKRGADEALRRRSNTMSNDSKLWGGRFSTATNAFVESFTASVQFDQRLYRQDIQGSVAHANMLATVGVLSSAERDQITKALAQIEDEIERGQFNWSIPLEDVHMNIEARLTELIGVTGKKLHTGRSRNDQVATDIRLYLRDQIDELTQLMDELLSTLLRQAEAHADDVMPGFTHLQTAQPITFGHHLMAWFEMLFRDRERLQDCRRRTNVSPLGAAALAGTTFPIDRAQTATELGFTGPCENSLDAVSDRDFAIEFCACASITMMHMSRWCEELVLWSCQQFDFIELSDSYCTGSSIMPQKKNPDVPELVRGKYGRVAGHLVGLLSLMKSQPLAYNKDNQEDKEPLFDTIDTLGGCLHAMVGLLGELRINAKAMAAAAEAGFATATDLADYLVRRGVAFRDAHDCVGKAVAFAIESQRNLSDLSLTELQGFNQSIGEDVFEVLTLAGSVNARAHFGATAPSQVRAAIERGTARLAALN